MSKIREKRQEKPASDADKSGKKDKIQKPKDSANRKRYFYVIKITFITLILSLVFSFISEITADKANLIVAIILLLFLIIMSIVFDGIGVAATSCDIVPLLSMAAKKVPAAKVGVMLVKNAEKVSNICGDVIGDICAIVSGACSAAIVIKLTADNPDTYWLNMIFSAIVAALTVGGKAFVKNIAVRNSKEMIMFAARIVSVFYHPRKNK